MQLQQAASSSTHHHPANESHPSATSSTSDSNNTDGLNPHKFSPLSTNEKVDQLPVSSTYSEEGLRGESSTTNYEASIEDNGEKPAPILKRKTEDSDPKKNEETFFKPKKRHRRNQTVLTGDLGDRLQAKVNHTAVQEENRQQAANSDFDDFLSNLKF